MLVAQAMQMDEQSELKVLSHQTQREPHDRARCTQPAEDLQKCKNSFRTAADTSCGTLCRAGRQVCRLPYGNEVSLERDVLDLVPPIARGLPHGFNVVGAAQDLLVCQVGVRAELVEILPYLLAVVTERSLYVHILNEVDPAGPQHMRKQDLKAGDLILRSDAMLDQLCLGSGPTKTVRGSFRISCRRERSAGDLDKTRFGANGAVCSQSNFEDLKAAPPASPTLSHPASSSEFRGSGTERRPNLSPAATTSERSSGRA